MQIKKDYQNITFSNDSYIIDGKPYPRVSTFLANLDKSALIQWSANKAVEYICDKLTPKFNLKTFKYEFDDEFKKDVFTLAKTAHRRIKEDAGDVGTLIHNAIEHWLKDKDYKPMAKTSQDFEIINTALENFKKWWVDNKFELIASEMPIGSIEHGYGGRIDILARQGDDIILIDLKTSKGVWKSHKIQCALYAMAIGEMCLFLSNKNRMIFHVNKSIICHIPKTNPIVKAINIEGKEFEYCKKAGLDLVRLYYNLRGIK